MPLDLLYKSGKGKIERMNSPLYELFLPKTKTWPSIKKNKKLSNSLTSEEVLDLSIDADVSLLKALIKLIPVSASINTSIHKQKKTVIHLNDARSDEIGQLALDEYLQSAALNTNAKDTVDKMKSGELYVITETVKTKSYTVKNENSGQSGFNVKASAKNIADAGIGIDTSKNTESGMAYSGDSYLTFCVKASRIKYDQSGFFKKEVTYRLRKDENIVWVLGDEKFPSEALAAENGITDF